MPNDMLPLWLTIYLVLRRAPARPSNPVPSSSMVMGSGTSEAKNMPIPKLLNIDLFIG